MYDISSKSDVILVFRVATLDNSSVSLAHAAVFVIDVNMPLL